MSIIGVQISAAIHNDNHPERVADCMSCAARAGDWAEELAIYRRQQAAYGICTCDYSRGTSSGRCVECGLPSSQVPA